jgi:ATP-dependent exoDNAse (exonuclease V) beta subunit
MAKNCPHQLFQDTGSTGNRASQGKSAFNLDAVEIKAKRNHACRMAELVLQTVINNKRRHDEIQRFMLITDSVTVAVEVPIILTPEDIRHMQGQLGFQIPIETDTTLTGHIDVLQLRNGKIHILDYKPGAAKEKPVTQLMVYALALSRRTGLRLYDFVCAWFDEHHYFEFYPLHVVHKRRRK